MRAKLHIVFFLIGICILSNNCFGDQLRPNILLQAVKNDDVKKITELLEDPDILCRYLDPECPGLICKPTFFAARNGSLKIFQLLVDAGADIDGKNGKSGDTALIIASYMHNHKLARFLITNGADVNKANNFGATPFWGACFMGDYELVYLFIDKAKIDFPGKYPDVFKNKGEKKQFVENITPLMAASKSGNIEIIRLLISNGADIHLKDSLGRSAVDYAIKFNHQKVYNFLQKTLNQ